MHQPQAQNRTNEETLVTAMGDAKPFQIIVILWLCLSKFGSSWHTLAIIFIAAPLEFKCFDPADNETDKCAPECVEREYDQTVFEKNIISEWELVCENAHLAALSQIIVVLGMMTGSLLFGLISDLFGRRVALLSCTGMQLLTGPLVALAPWFWLFCTFRFLVAMATGGIVVVSFVIVMELIGPRKRELISIAYQLPFNAGHASMALLGYYLRHWRTYYLTISLLSLMFIPYMCAVPETPRWLCTTGRVDRAVMTLEQAAKFNKMSTADIRRDVELTYKATTTTTQTTMSREREHADVILDLFRYPNLRMKTCVMAFEWLVVCLIYYSLAQYFSMLHEDLFVNVALGACLGIPGILLCIPLVKYLGRKLTLILSNSLSCACLFLIAYLDREKDSIETLLAAIGLFGASITFPNIYLYAAELFPTVFRGFGLGFCSLAGRLGSILAPLVVHADDSIAWLSPLLLGGFSAVAVVAAFLLPETKGQQMPDTVKQAEQFGKHR